MKPSWKWFAVGFVICALGGPAGLLLFCVGLVAIWWYAQWRGRRLVRACTYISELEMGKTQQQAQFTAYLVDYSMARKMGKSADLIVDTEFRGEEAVLIALAKSMGFKE